MPSRAYPHKSYVELMRIRRRQLLKAFAAGGSVGLVSFLAGCARSLGPTPSPQQSTPTQSVAVATKPTGSTATPTGSSAAATSTSVAPAKVVSPVASGSGLPATIPSALRLNLLAEPETLDPGRASFEGEFEIVRRVFSNTYIFDSKAQLSPDQADGPPQISADGRKITIKLKKGLVWSDGKPLSAKDFVYGAKRQLNPALQSGYAFTLYPIKGAEKYNSADPKELGAADLRKLRDAVGVSAPDDTTLVYELEEPTPWFLSVLATCNALPVREDIVTASGKAEDNQDWVQPSTYIGNGPYVLAKHEPGVQIVVEANPRYTRGAPPIKTVQYFMIKDNAAAFTAYTAGNLDVTSVTALTKDAVDKDPALKSQFQSGPEACTYYVGFNLARPPFDNLKVRRAFSAAMDRKTFAEQVLKGLALPASQFLPPNYPGHFEDIPLQKFDPAMAKSLLAEAGFPGGQGLPPVKLTYASVDFNKLVAEALQAMFTQHLGLNITLDPVEPRAFSSLVRRPETTPQMFTLGWCHDYPDPQNWYSNIFHSSGAARSLSWKNEEFDKLTQRADLEIDPNKREQLYKQAATILNADTPVAFLWHSVAAKLIKPEVKGYQRSLFDYFFGQNSLYEMKLDR